MLNRFGHLSFLLVLGAPFLRATFSLPDARVLPPGAEARVVSETLTRDFPQDETRLLRILVRTDGPAQLVGAGAAAAALGTDWARRGRKTGRTPSRGAAGAGSIGTAAGTMNRTCGD